MAQDLRQTQEWANYLKLIGWQVEKVPDFLYVRKIPLLPLSIGKLQRAKNVDWELVQRARKEHRIIKLITEETVARKTIWIDLKKSEKQLLTEMKQKTRYNIGLAKKRGVVTHVRTNPNGVSLYELLRSNAKRLGIFAMPRKWYEAQVESFGKKCFAVLAYHNSELVAGNFFMTSNDACFYSHNGSTELGRKLMAPSLCVWEGIRKAKRRKLKIFDFDGIDDGSNNLKRWKGFTKFKQGFGGEEITFPISS